MALVNPQIAMSFRPTVEYQPRNALAEYAQIQNIMGGQRQAEVAEMQLRRMQQEDAEIERVHQIAMRSGGPDNRLEMGRALFASRNPQQRELGYKILQHEEAKAQFNTAMQQFGYAPAAATTTAPAAATTTAPAATEPPIPRGLTSTGSQTFDSMIADEALRNRPAPITYGPTTAEEIAAARARNAAPAATVPAAVAPAVAPAATNALAPAAAASATTNALAAPAGKTADQLRQEILVFSASTDPRAQAMAEVLKTQLAELTKTHTVGGRIVSGAGRVLYTAPTEISTVEDEIAALRAKGVKDTDPRIVSRQGKIAQLSGAGTPLDITRAMAQRDQLLASGRPSTDPDVKALNDYIRKQTTHQPAAQQNVYAYTPASEVAQQDFMRGARATYDTLKNAPATLNNIEAAKALIPTAAGFMGPGGEPLLKAASFLNNRFGTGINTRGVTDATELRSRLFAGVIENLRKLDAQPTAAQQQVLQDAIGNLGTDPTALPRVLDAMAQSIRDKVELYNRDVTGAEQRGVRFPYKPQIELPAPGRAGSSASSQIPAGAPAAAAGNTVTLPNGTVMTFPNAEAAAKFKRDARLP